MLAMAAAHYIVNFAQPVLQNMTAYFTFPTRWFRMSPMVMKKRQSEVVESRPTRGKNEEEEPKEPPSAKMDPYERRWLEASIEGGPLQQGKFLILYAQLVVTRSETGNVIGAEAQINPGIDHVTFSCQSEGFKLISDAQKTVAVSPGTNTDKAPFVFEILSAQEYRITLSAYQDGALCGQVVIDDFASLEAVPPISSPNEGRHHNIEREPMLRPRFIPDLTLAFSGPEFGGEGMES